MHSRIFVQVEEFTSNIAAHMIECLVIFHVHRMNDNNINNEKKAQTK